MEKIKEFCKKIASKLQVEDYKGLYSKEGVVNLLYGYGYPKSALTEITESNWEELYILLTNI